eukprot:GEMP01015583.1.p1 GENE.GEMP01015583.1~~GEMP01015583.1.p1  ORF type:complete len:705 (+),score=133.76 GEMP01015583.1:63-2177(+)
MIGGTQLIALILGTQSMIVLILWTQGKKQETIPGWQDIRDAGQQIRGERYIDDRHQFRARAIELVSAMTLDEKISLLSGTETDHGYCGFNPGVPRLNIPEIRCNDGPQGFRQSHGAGNATQWASSLHVGASWDVDLVHAWGIRLANEFRGKGANCILGPGVNVHRVPVGGRNWEYITGEEPLFGAVMAEAYVVGAQSQDIFTVPKHYIFNNQEKDRQEVSAVVSPQAQHEVYSTPFRGAIQGGAGSFMCSYNRINGTYSCANKDTLGWLHDNSAAFIMSDWGATHNGSFENGMDMAMASDTRFSAAVVKANLAAGNYTMDEVDNKARNIVTTMLVARQDVNFPVNGSLGNVVTSPENDAFNTRIAAEGTVMLREGPLPLDRSKRVKFFQCDNTFIVHGTGSGQVLQEGATIFEAAKKLGANVEQIATLDGVSKDDTVVACTSLTAGEGSDRTDLRLKDGFMADLIKKTASIVVVISSPGVVLMPWAEDKDFSGGILLSFFPGAQGGVALAEILYYLAEPQGRLPVTIPFEHAQLQFTKEAYPGVDLVVQYTEDLAVGRRWFQSENIIPLFYYGYGRSWTNFKIQLLQISNARQFSDSCEQFRVDVLVSNTGERAGHEVVQIYAQMEGRPFTQLVGFRKVAVLAGESVRFVHDVQLAVWTYDDGWRAPVGTVKMFVGNSSVEQRNQVATITCTRKAAAPGATFFA